MSYEERGLGFVMQAVSSAITKLVVYRRGF